MIGFVLQLSDADFSAVIVWLHSPVLSSLELLLKARTVLLHQGSNRVRRSTRYRVALPQLVHKHVHVSGCPLVQFRERIGTSLLSRRFGKLNDIFIVEAVPLLVRLVVCIADKVTGCGLSVRFPNLQAQLGSLLSCLDE